MPATLIRRGKETWLALQSEERAIGERDPALIKLVAEAHIAREDYFGVLLRISYLAPDIVAAILDGRQPAQLTRQRLARMTSLPIDWQQREMLGFG
ncbi:hypothetical protein [Rhizorhabdus wittichii]|uniref:hypothetical protein n=1 Tax=Rhizorhabdus wittichii TaxID=160791 RepID=UPI0002DC11F2|nr:hypothetical protein [Rhizorhabdus wittichii]